MITPPNAATAFPDDYLAFLATLQANLVLPGTESFLEPKDSGMALGGPSRRGETCGHVRPGNHQHS